MKMFCVNSEMSSLNIQKKHFIKYLINLACKTGGATAGVGWIIEKGRYLMVNNTYVSLVEQHWLRQPKAILFQR